jgi:hypothetical protein
MNEPHACAVMFLNGWLIERFGMARVRIQLPVDVAPEDNPTHEPGPDAVVLTRSVLEIEGPGDVALLAEVADTSLALDLTDKASL